MSSTENFRIDPTQACLVVVDIQEKLAPTMPSDVLQKVLRNTGILISTAQEFQIPILLTEQYTKGLGPTRSEVKSLLGDMMPMEKLAFSCCGLPEFSLKLKSLGKQYVILCGMETHVCVLQTALDMLDGGSRVFLPADAVCSRKKLDWKVGLNVMGAAGVIVGSTELFFFQMLKEAGTDRFKKLSKLVK